MSRNDAEEIREVLGALSETVPALINDLITSVMASIYSAEAGRDLGKAAGAFYNELIASGISEDAALEMTKSYMGTLQDVVSKANIEHGRHSIEPD